MRHRSGQNPFSLFSFQDIITGLCGILIFFVLIMLVDFISRRESPQVPSAAPVTENMTDDGIDALRQEIDALTAELDNARKTSQTAIAASGETASPEAVRRKKKEIDAESHKLCEIAAIVASLRKRADAVRNDKAKIANLEKARLTLESKLAKIKANTVTLIPERGVLRMPICIICGRNEVEVLCPLENGVERKRIASRNLENGIAEVLERFDRAQYAVVLMVRPSGAWRMDSLAAKVRSLGFGCGRDPLEEDATVNISSVGGDR